MKDWIPPIEEHEWAECLSAYLDGELPEEEREAVGAALGADPERAAQLDALRKSSAMVRAWNVEAPEPDPAFIQSLAGWPATPAARFFRAAPAWALAAMFLIGLLCGSIGTTLGREPSSGAVPGPPHVDVAVGEESVSGISPRQAEDLLREVAADGIKMTLLKQLRGRDWAAALATYQELVSDYAGTVVVNTLERGRGSRLLRELEHPQWRTKL